MKPNCTNYENCGNKINTYEVNQPQSMCDECYDLHIYNLEESQSEIETMEDLRYWSII